MAKKKEEIIEVVNDDAKLVKELFKGYSCVVPKVDYKPENDLKPIRTGSISLDLSTGIGGLPKGKIIEFYGEESSGKSTQAYRSIAQYQKDNPDYWALIINPESSLDVEIPKQREYLINLGVDLNRIIIIYPNILEDIHNSIKEALDHKTLKFRLFVIDSISAVNTLADDKKDIETTTFSRTPSKINEVFKSLAKHLFLKKATLIEINQVRENIEAKSNPMMAKYLRREDKVKATGGAGLRHWISMKIFFWKKKEYTNDKRHYLDIVHTKVVKTRFDQQRFDGEMYHFLTKGFDEYKEIIELAKRLGILYKKSASAQNWLWKDHDSINGDNGKKERRWYYIFKTDDSLYDDLYEQVTMVYNKYFDDLNLLDIYGDLESLGSDE